jgi:cyclic-di-GMP-binding protein
MNQAYKKLAEGLPARRDARNIAFPTDPKRVKPWIDALPRANQAQTQRHLAEALLALRDVRLDGGQRLAILEQLRPVLLEAATALDRAGQGASFPLPPAKARAMAQLQAFEADLAFGYRLAVIELCAPSGGVPLLRGGTVALAVERALLHQSLSLMHAYALYQTPATGAWQNLHALYRFGCSHRLEDRAVDDEAGTGKTTIRQVYTQALLLALSNPYRFSQKDQAELWLVARGFAGLLGVGPKRGSAEAFAIPVDTDAGPGYIAEERADDGGALLWLDVTPLREALENPLDEVDSGPVRVRLSGGAAVDSTAELLRRLRAGWGSASARLKKRIGAEHALDTVIGLSGVHFHLADGRDFDAFMRLTGNAGLIREGERHEWAQGAVAANRIPMFRASVLDQSLGGYRVRWPEEQQVKARVGELIGLSLVGDHVRHWMLGIVRWLRYAADGSVDGGIELLARRARAVAVRNIGVPERTRQDLRAIEFEAVRAPDDAALRLVVPGMLDMAGGELEVLRRASDEGFEDEAPNSETCREARVLENAGDYMIVSAIRLVEAQ